MEKVQEKIEFTVGREMEVGGTYKGIVTSVKEYGAFVELNGGQQGLLHVSELSHEPVSRVSDVVSVGQQLTVMCIGQDVRGNIKLSLKATSPRQASEPNNVVKQAVPIWPSVKDGPSSQEQDSKEESSSQSMESYTSRAPSILIRSAAECEEEEKSAGLLETLKNSKLSKKSASSTEKRSELKSTFTGEGDEETEKEAPTAKNLKLGMRVTAKVHKVLGRGLILDLGNGVRGMYRFEEEGKADYEVGDLLRVVCTSFSSKGVPVMSLLKDD